MGSRLKPLVTAATGTAVSDTAPMFGVQEVVAQPSASVELGDGRRDHCLHRMPGHRRRRREPCASASLARTVTQIGAYNSTVPQGLTGLHLSHRAALLPGGGIFQREGVGRPRGGGHHLGDTGVGCRAPKPVAEYESCASTRSGLISQDRPGRRPVPSSSTR